MKIMPESPLIYRNTVLFVKDIGRSKAFYQKFLLQKTAFDFDKTMGFTSGIALWEVQQDHPLNAGKADSAGFELYFDSEDLDGDYHNIKKAGLRFKHEIREENWGQRTIRFYDPDGHLIEIGESLEVFVGRMARTMTVAEITAKTSIPEADVKKIIGEEPAG